MKPNSTQFPKYGGKGTDKFFGAQTQNERKESGASDEHAHFGGGVWGSNCKIISVCKM